MTLPAAVDAPAVLAAVAAVALALGVLIGHLLTRLRQAGAAEKNRELQQRQLADLNETRVQLETRLQAARDDQQRLAAQLAEAQAGHHELQRQHSERGEKIAALQTELEQERRIAAEKLEELQLARQQLSKDFEILANRIFDEKTERFKQHSKTALDQTLNPLREQLSDFKKKVEDVYDRESKERISLSVQLSQLKELNQQMSHDAVNLTRALKGDNKTQGNWGEVILERVLEESGLHKGREYETQVSVKSEQGQSRPDVIVRLPDNKDIVIDAKVSLVHYERYCNADNDEERQQALKDHVNSVREHIRSLSIKSYENLPGLQTLDFVFIFIPIESAFMAAFEHDQAMFRDAYEKNVIVVGPTTLLATLRTVQSIWRYERQNKNAEEIARQAGAMHDKFVGFIDDLEKIAEHLERASQAQASAMNKLKTGRGNLVNSSVKLEKLGAKVKKAIPASVREDDEDLETLLGLDADSLVEIDDTEQ